MIVSFSQVACMSSSAESGIIPVLVAPLGSSRFTSTPLVGEVGSHDVGQRVGGRASTG
jgi:hypothetical protein